MTFSIAARCPTTGMFAIAVSSSSPAVAARCAHARAGVGCVATQNITDPTLGPKGLDLMASGLSAKAALERLAASAAHVEFRQLTMVDRHGGTATRSGARTLGTHATAEGPGVVAAGNLLKTRDVPKAMVAAFLAMPNAGLGDRVIAGMQAAVKAGGEEGPVHSAGLLLVRDVAWPIADLRVDWHDTDPIGELAKLWELWKPQMEGYVTRALNPTEAPSFGVPGDT
jgi:uncharacterized Ntn-hydrolase superfamily protein